MHRIYQVISEKLGTEYPLITYNKMDDSKENSVGIFLYPSEADKETLDGQTVYESLKAHIQVNAERSDAGEIKAIAYLRNFVSRIESEKSTIPGVKLRGCLHVGMKSQPIGVNSFNIPVYVTNVAIKYILTD